MTLITFIANLFIRTLHATLRVRHVNAENLQNLPQAIITFWHAHLLLMLHSKFKRPIMVMSSKSRDGEYIARVFSYYDVEVVRGSSSRGGSSAIRELIRRARKGRSIVFTPDGPRGPARIAKEGIVFAAQTTGLPIVPIAFAAKKKSFLPRGTGWRSRTRSPRPSFSTAHQSSCRVTATSNSGA